MMEGQENNGESMNEYHDAQGEEDFMNPSNIVLEESNEDGTMSHDNITN
jgi:hypothetical protein